MSGFRTAAVAVFFVVSALAAAPRARALEGLDGRLQIHGFGENVLRVVSNDFDDDWDVWQWQWILNVEAELDIAPDGWGPFSAVSAFARVEARYDCIWSRGCSMFPSMDAFGDRVHKLPKYKTNAHESEFTATTFGDPTATNVHRSGRPLRVFEGGPFEGLFETKGPDQLLGTNDDPAPLIFGELQNWVLAVRDVRGSRDGRGDQILVPLRPKDRIETSIGRFRFYPNASSPLEENPSCAVSSAKPVQGCRYANTVAPLQGMDPNLAAGEQGFNVELLKPFHPYPKYSAASAERMNIPLTEASGLYMPSAGLRELLQEEKLDLFDQDFREHELAWNRGASQQDEGELKELYFDLEMFDGRLYFRIGKQSIVWGKTELFRSQDQFNPQDLALSTLPSLEESRIGLWAAKAIYSFYDVGPLEDVRLELAVLLDDFEPTDLGRCGEPYTPFPVYGKCLGLIAHSAAGLGVAGEIRPPAWWNSSRGLEYGARLEFRWRRFSVALTDYYGFDDFPVAEPIFKYERNVDPRTGRPRMAGSRRGCDPEGLFDGDSAGCLGAPTNRKFPDLEGNGFNAFNNATWASGIQNSRILAVKNLNQRSNVAENLLYQHPANQTLFALACAAATGFTDFIPEVASECGFNIFGSGQVFATGAAPPFDFIPVVAGISMIVGGSASLFEAAIQLLSPDAAGILTVVPLNHNDLGPRRCTSPTSGQNNINGFPGTSCINDYDYRSRTHEGVGPLDAAPGAVPPNTQLLFASLGGLSSALTPEQQALLGCGAYFGSSCDRQGMDLLNAEASALFQSFPGFEGSPLEIFQSNNKGIAQPGTVGFQGGPVCTRVERGKQYVLPGCRGPGDAGYDPAVDGAPYFSELHNATPSTFDLGTGAIAFSNLRTFQDISMRFGCQQLLGTPRGPADPAEPAATSDRGRLLNPNVRLFHPFTCQPFKSEMAALSFNFMALLVVFSGDADDDGFSKPEDFDEFDPKRAFTPGRCSLVTPQFCSAVRDLLSATGVQRNDLKAGGNGRFGRRDFAWHGGSELALRYPKRNVPGFSVDFAEDHSKTNWSLEFTMFQDIPVADRDSNDGLTDVTTYNLTISVDRPTFVNFLNANRTLFFNWQFFISYNPQHTPEFEETGPWNVLATFTTLTGYFQDRLEVALTFVYDMQSNSGAGLPALTYRFSENFSATFGMNFFFGRYQRRTPYLMPTAIDNRVGRHAYQDFVEPGLSVVRDRDEVNFRLRYTF
jgi:hypothetical protein